MAAKKKFQTNKPVGIWLLTTAFMVFCMAIIGAITRLTESGLSIVEWNVVMGILPPMTPEAWQAEFAKYQKIPEYIEINNGMSLSEFKEIYWWEYIHRLWGRVIGVVYALPLAIFWARHQLPRWLKPHTLALLVLGGIQGYIGWWMVKSGLTERTDVSQYRLAVHLTMALAIFTYSLWLAFRVLIKPPARSEVARFRTFSLVALGMVTLTAVLGAFVAGMNAGLMYNTWPSMDGDMVPPGLWVLQPFYLNFFENPTMIQFLHRWTAQITVIVTLVLVWRVLKAKPAKNLKVPVIHVGVMVVLQALLGIKALLLGVPIALGAIHQAGAFLLVGFMVWMLYQVPRSK